MILTLVAFVVVLSVLVFAHEMGHYTTAKLFGVKVEEFGMRFPPRGSLHPGRFTDRSLSGRCLP